MIPYIEPPALDLGPITIHAFGVLVALALVVGLEMFRRRATRSGLDAGVASRLSGWVLIAGVLGAHLVDRLFYNLGETLADPLSLFAVWEGISSFGGMLGGILGAWLFFRRHPQGHDTWRYLDAMAYAVPVAWLIGRIGCFLAFDHVGLPTGFFLGQEYRDGVVRHNLGLEEALYWIPVAAMVAYLGRRPRTPGVLAATVAILYAPGRFLLDFLRVSDDRVGGLIVSQYAAIALFLVGLCFLVRKAGPGSTRPKALC